MADEEKCRLCGGSDHHSSADRGGRGLAECLDYWKARSESLDFALTEAKESLTFLRVENWKLLQRPVVAVIEDEQLLKQWNHPEPVLSIATHGHAVILPFSKVTGLNIKWELANIDKKRKERETSWVTGVFNLQ